VTAWRSYALALALVALVTGLGELVDPFLDVTNLVMFYLLGVVLTALVAGRGPAALSAGLSVLAFDFFFVPPRYTFAVSDTEYFVTFAALLVVGLLVGDLTARERDQVQSSRRSQLQVMAAYALSRDLAQAANEHEIVAALMASLQGPLGVPATLYLPQGERLVVHPASLHQLSTPEDVAVATWSYRNGQPAGCGTDTLPAVSDFYFPLRQGDQTVAVLRLKLDGNSLTASQRQLVETLTNLEAMALHRVRLTEEARRAQLLEETERLHTILFNSVSHDLQTPITSIMGCLESLLDPALQGDEAARASLLSNAREQTDRLRGLVVNLLDMSRVEARQTRLNREPCELSDLIGSALGRLEQAYAKRPVETEIPADFPMIPVDFVLFTQVLYNLLENAAKYSPALTPVHIEARVVDKIARRAQIRISDRGAGIPAESRERVFDKFFRLSDKVSGTGLGLAISRGLVELHGGSLWVEERPGGGSTFVIQIPLEEAA
jgi:two-component system sensor histidine kinase KdpD